jgi:hypothetical protein
MLAPVFRGEVVALLTRGARQYDLVPWHICSSFAGSGIKDHGSGFLILILDP